jgi:microcystin degradation protein MlrC
MPEAGMRIAIGGISHETNTFTRVWSDYGDFRILRGAALFDDRMGAPEQVEGVELVPTYLARTVPGGLVRRAAYLQLREELLQELRVALPFKRLQHPIFPLDGAFSWEPQSSGRKPES